MTKHKNFKDNLIDFIKMAKVSMKRMFSMKISPPKIKMPKPIKIDFKKEVERVLAERKRGVVRRKWYGAY